MNKILKKSLGLLIREVAEDVLAKLAGDKPKEPKK